MLKGDDPKNGCAPRTRDSLEEFRCRLQQTNGCKRNDQEAEGYNLRMGRVKEVP